MDRNETSVQGAGPDARARLHEETEAALTRELLRTFHTLNFGHFRGVLRAPTLKLDATERRLGQWHPETRTLSLSYTLVLERPWGEVVEVLKHEMAHQYVTEVLGKRDETPHGPSFRAVCERLGIDATAAGAPQPSVGTGTGTGGSGDAAEDEVARKLKRIARLLALAESQNVNEAEAAMREAQRLMLKHNIDAAVSARARRYGYRHLGPVRRRVDESQRLLAMLLGRHFFVEAIWVPSYDARSDVRGTVLEVCGTPENLEMAAYVHDFLHRTAERLWLEHKRVSGTRSDRDRRTYLSGVMLGFGERLARDAEHQQEEGLIWLGDLDLGRFFRQRHPHVRRIQQKGQPRTAARAEGKKAGRQIVLHRPIEQGGSGPGAPRLLPGRR